MDNHVNQPSRRTALKAGLLIAGTGLLSFHETLVWARGSQTTPQLTEAEIAGIEKAFGKKGQYKEKEATYNTPFPRNDLKIKVKGDAVPIPFGFGGWAAIKRTLDGSAAVLMSDCVLLQEEVNPLINAAQAVGLEIGAIHNHFFYEEPRIFYMHLHGVGDPVELAQKYARAIAGTNIDPSRQPSPGQSSEKKGNERFDLSKLDSIVGDSAAINGTTVKYTIGRADLKVMAMGAEITTAIGMNSWASFTGTMERAYIAGDIAMLEGEVNAVVAVLRKHGLEVVAIHNHMLGDEPHMIFLHYLGIGPAEELAYGFKAALDVLGKKGQGHQHTK